MVDLHSTAAAMVAPGRGILAADESIGTMSSRFDAEGIEASPTSRRDYRALLVTAPGLARSVSGVILNPETFDDTTADGTDFPQACRVAGLLPGVKVDTGTVAMSGDDGPVVTTGLEGLGERLAHFAAAGAAFAKWRAVIDIATADDASLEANTHALARYAALCQEHGIVPIVEPEVLCTGAHDIEASADMTTRVLVTLFQQIDRSGVDLRGIVLKPNMATPGLDAAPASPDEIADVTLSILHAVVPPQVPGVAFLSGGHPTDAACAALAAMNTGERTQPWELTFSFGRALVSDALHTWAGAAENVDAAQEVLLRNCRRAAASRPDTVAVA